MPPRGMLRRSERTRRRGRRRLHERFEIRPVLVLLREMLAVDADGVCRRRKEKRRERDDEDDESETAGGTRVTVERMFRTLLKVCGATESPDLSSSRRR